MPLTDDQKNAVAQMRAYYLANSPFPGVLGTAQSVDERARLPDPALVPADVTARFEIAPPSSHPHPLFDSAILKAPERVPVYFYSLHSDQAESDVADTLVIFYINGGGNFMGHPTDQMFIQLYVQLLRAVASRSGETSKCVVVAPSYRLATVPENTFPAALQDIVAAYEYVLGKGYKASNVVLAGDSVGGSHAVVLTHLMLQSGQHAPRGIIAIAPTAIQVYDQLSENTTDVLTPSFCETLVNTYVGDSGVAPTDPFVSCAFIPFTASWPKTLILVGSQDLTVGSSRELAKRLLAVIPAVELVEYDERPHGWCMLPNLFLEDIQDAAARAAKFALESPTTVGAIRTPGK